MKKSIPVLVGLALLSAGGLASAANCSIVLDGNDRMQFDQKSVEVSASCARVTVELKHSGKLPKAAMGHNVVITAEADVTPVAQAALKAGAANDYLPTGDKRVIAATKLLGGGESTKITFPGSALKAGGDYAFFCSFPGHSALMRGKVVVKP
jgi:azurin